MSKGVRWTSEEYETYKALQYAGKVEKVVAKKKAEAKKRKKNKHNARGRYDEEGRYFGSIAEYDRSKELQLLEKAGAIKDLMYQPTYILTEAKVKYRADFQYSQDGTFFAEDVKGQRLARFKVIVQLWRYYGEIPLRITKRKGKGFIIEETINIKEQSWADNMGNYTQR